MPNNLSSLPYPDYLIPPNGKRGSDLTKALPKQHAASRYFVAISSPL